MSEQASLHSKIKWLLSAKLYICCLLTGIIGMHIPWPWWWSWRQWWTKFLFGSGTVGNFYARIAIVTVAFDAIDEFELIGSLVCGQTTVFDTAAIFAGLIIWFDN